MTTTQSTKQEQFFINDFLEVNLNKVYSEKEFTVDFILDGKTVTHHLRGLKEVTDREYWINVAFPDQIKAYRGQVVQESIAATIVDVVTKILAEYL